MPLSTDRWIEIDVGWFDPPRLAAQADELFDRLLPLYESVTGTRGLILCCDWVIDLVTEWTGDPAQRLPFGSLLLTHWKQKTYADLKNLFAILRQAAHQHGLNDFKLGVFFIGWGRWATAQESGFTMYDSDSHWYSRHPELYPFHASGNPDPDPSVRLHADTYHYAARPHGLKEGDSFPEIFGAQWGALSRFLELDAIHLRDQFFGGMIYQRRGPFGLTASPDPQEMTRWVSGVIELFREVKRGNPQALVMGYSSAISAIAEWRVGCADLEAVVTDGGIDMWIDQTWGGAWQDWWCQEWKGWTFQLAYLLIHRAMIEAGNQKRPAPYAPCKHYNLIEAWDGWEPWDTLHQVPQKLRWAMWAFSHAALHTPNGLRVPDGSYLAWANNRAGQLWSADDVNFIGQNLDAAQASAGQLEQVYGPTLVYNRALMDWLAMQHPEWNVSEWIDDQAGLLMKWGVPCLSATRLEWLNTAQADGYIFQVPRDLPDPTRSALQPLAREGVPLIFSGRADVIDPALLEMAGVKTTGNLQPSGFSFARAELPPDEKQSEGPLRVHLPVTQPVALSGGEALFESAHMPLIVQKDNVIYWQPLDWSQPGNPFFPRYQLGTLAPYMVLARTLNETSARSGRSYVQSLPLARPVTVHLWRSGGKIHVLIGNLETNFLGDGRIEREVTLVLRRQHLALGTGNYRLRNLDDGQWIAPTKAEANELYFDLHLAPAGSNVYELTG